MNDDDDDCWFAGEAKVLQVFYISEGRSRMCIAGCRCTKGVLNKKKDFKVLRQGELIYQGKAALFQMVSSVVSVFGVGLPA